MNDKLVSIITITYNHEKWIEKTINGILSQDTDFPFENIIAEDSGTDTTRTICEEYALNNPNIISLLPSIQNLGAKINEKRAMEAATGKYIAFCEGDDYWTNPNKLQAQVNFLEKHPDHSVCFTRWHNKLGNQIIGDGLDALFTEGQEFVPVSLETFFEHWVTQPMTMMYRADAISTSLYDKYKYYRDQHQIYHLLKNGKGAILNIDSGIRVIHKGGMASSRSELQAANESVEIANELFRQNRDTATKNYLISTIKWHLKISHSKKLKYSLKLFCLERNIKHLIKNLAR